MTNTNLISQIESLRNSLDNALVLALGLPQESETCRYYIMGESILMYIPYDLDLFRKYRDDLINRLDFKIDNYEWELNEHGVKEHEQMDMDSLRLVHKEFGTRLTLWLELRHPRSSKLLPRTFSISHEKSNPVSIL